MPDPGHVKKLVQGPAAWNAWRARDPSIIPDLTAAAPTLGQRQMGFSHGGPINLRYALLQDADFRFATLTAADLEGANLARANLTEARLDGANLTAADLSDASLDKADFNGAVLERTNLAGASLRGARHLTRAQLWQAMGDANTALPDDLICPPHWLARSASAKFEERQPEEPCIARPDGDRQQTRIAGSPAAAEIALGENVLSQTTQQAGLPEAFIPPAIEFKRGLDYVDVEVEQAWPNGPRAGSRSHLATVFWLCLFLAVLGFAWYVAIALVDERSATWTAPSLPPVELEDTGVTVVPQPATESKRSFGPLDRRNSPSLRQDVQPSELNSPALVLPGTPSTPSTIVPSASADKPPVKARAVPRIVQPAPSTKASTVRVGQSEPPTSNMESGPPPSADVPQPKRRKPAEANSRDAASDVLTGGLQ